MKISKLELIRGIRAILSDESKWCKFTAAVDIHGNRIGAIEANAVSFCVFGAARRAVGLGLGQVGARTAGNPFWAVLNDIAQSDKPTATIGAYNDSHTYAEISERLQEVEAMYTKEEEDGIPATS